MIWCFGIGFAFLFLGLFLMFYPKWLKKNNQERLEKKGKKDPSIAILIPARDESKVIEGLLQSIEEQTLKVPSQNIYIIVESKKDPTVTIAKKHQMQIFIRKKLELKTKGYALQELVEDLAKKKIYYDCYFIFDADNRLEKDFLEKMIKDYQKGYAISTGYRSLKNKDKVFPVSAGLTFYLVNEVRNQMSLKKNGNIILSGTGYYIHGKYIKEWQTFPFHSLTEDYESSLYYALHQISTHYCEDACFYDEQPEKYKTSIKQRSRWIKGYFTNWFHYRKKLKEKRKQNPSNYASLLEMEIGILPVILIIIGFILILGFGIFLAPAKLSLRLLLFVIGLGLIYLLLVIITAMLLWIATKKMPLKKEVILGVLFYHPIFLISYVHALFVAIFDKNLGWEKIERKSKL